MRIVFLNSLDKEYQGELISTAQIWIGEEQGLWRIGWDELHSDNVHNEIWFEGESWAEMLHVYRYQMAVKLASGYRAMIGGVFHENESGQGSLTQKLICYSELHMNEELYNILSAWRRKRAASQRKAPYLIASNRLLKLISTFVPMNAEELTQLPGVGTGKAEEYGSDVLSITEGWERERTFPLDWVEHELDEEDFRSWIYKQKEQRFKAEMEQFSQRRTLLTGIAEGLTIGQVQEQIGIQRREVVELLEQLEKEGYDTETILELELADMPKSEQETVWNAYEDLGDTFLKPVLQRVYGSEALLPVSGELERKYEQLRLIRIRYRRVGRSVVIQTA